LQTRTIAATISARRYPEMNQTFKESKEEEEEEEEKGKISAVTG
jgi:hypothetical protein